MQAGRSDTIGTQISFQGNQAVVLFTAMQSVILNIAGETNCGLDHTVASRWYHNGHSTWFEVGTTEEIVSKHLPITDSRKL